jgi:hypothetical protein
MSETGVGSASTDRADHGGLFDETGNPIGGGAHEREVDAVARFAREQPLATALVALGIGYVLGKML